MQAGDSLTNVLGVVKLQSIETDNLDGLLGCSLKTTRREPGTDSFMILRCIIIRQIVNLKCVDCNHCKVC